MDEVLYKKKEQRMSMTGFGGILMISKWTSIRTNFVKWVTNNWKTDTGPQIRLSPIKVLKITQDDVHRVYHLPRGDKRVDISQCKDNAIERLRDELSIGGSFSRTVHYNVLEEKLLNPRSITSWTKTAILCTICCLLCPVNGNNVDLRYASILEKFKDITMYNWCQHVLEHTTKGITVNNKLNPTFDFHFFLINYLERMYKQCRLLTGQFTTPLLSGWDESSTIAGLLTMEEMVGLSKAVVGVIKERRSEDAQVLMPFDPETCPMEKVQSYRGRCRGIFSPGKFAESSLNNCKNIFFPRLLRNLGREK
ncbi:hypothetical protein LIER_27725 [Lithospermum erythrorhizon]|uniref:Uncharacterized protein n=1 Tax=Lithospermum erythrorhizon TaxID=34254 RepID=A0AAV3RD21_LITER